MAPLWSLQELHEAARATTETRILRDWVDAGAGDGAAVRRNEEAFARWALRPRVLSGVATPLLATTVLGMQIAAPLMFAPSGLQALVTAHGELAAAEAARAAGLAMILSSNSSFPVEEVAAQGAPLWFQFYWGRDRGAVKELVERAQEAGCRALCLTVDMPAQPWLHAPMREALRALGSVRTAHGVSRDAHLDASAPWPHDARLTWADLAWLRSITSLPLVVKGIMTGHDAALAVDHGAAAVIVSNHGGRAMAHSQATLDVLPEVVDEVGGRVEVYIDGGVRSGSHVAIALALGARAVLVGRPVQWGLAVAAAAGVRRMVDILLDELRSVLTALGAADVTQLNRGHVAQASQR